MNIIDTHQLGKSFRARTNKNLITGIWRPDWKEVHAVRDVNLAIKAGESVAFLGPNGAGKTTTIKMLTGLIYPSTGDVRVLGFTPQDRKTEFLKRIGLVMGNKAGLNWDLSAAQSFVFLRHIYEIPSDQYDERVKRLTKLLRVEHVMNTQIRRLSLGERMKMELIGSILHDPEILFLDEPTIGLDIDAKREVRAFLRQLHKEQGKTLLLTSHDMDDIEEVCERVIVINKGSVGYDGSMGRLAKDHGGYKYVRVVFEDDIDPALLREFGKVVSFQDSVAQLKIKQKDYLESIQRIFATFKVADITIQSVPLEEIISDLFKKTG